MENENNNKKTSNISFSFKISQKQLYITDKINLYIFFTR